jgi:serine protease
VSEELARPRARVINISFGSDQACSQTYRDAIDAARDRGVLVVAAAGNESASSPSRPANCPGVIGVAALHQQGFKAGYSNFGSAVDLATVGGDDASGALGDSGILAPGNDGFTTPNASAYFFYYGTSFSTPLVAGAASLMLSVNPDLTADQIEYGLRTSARPHFTSSALPVCSAANPGQCTCTTSTCGAGILDVPGALEYAATTTTSNGGGGGGAMSAGWLLALAGAGLALARRRRR